MTTREKLLCMFLPDEARGIVPQQRAFYSRLNQDYHTLFYKPWEEYTAPFRVAGNVYYIGNRLLSIHLIVTEEGLIVYDTGFQHTMPLLVKGISDLGYKPEDVKYVVLTHGHFDHYGSAAWLQGLYGAKGNTAQFTASESRLPMKSAGLGRVRTVPLLGLAK